MPKIWNHELEYGLSLVNLIMAERKKTANSVNEPMSEGYQLGGKTKVFQFLEMAKKLSPSMISEIVKELVAMLKQNSNKANKGFSSFLLTGPVMSDSQFEEYKKQREIFNKWRQK